MNMILRDIHFPIREATISSYILDPDWLNKYGKNENPGLCWEVVVQTEEQPIGEEITAAPRISWGEFSFPLRRWLELEGQTIHSDAANQDPGAHAFSYFWTHEVIPYSTLKFVKSVG